AALDRGAPTLTAAVRQLVGPGTPSPVFASLTGGYRVLVDALAEAAGARLHPRSECTSIDRTPRGYALTVRGGTGQSTPTADLVVVAVPAPRAAPLLHGVGGLDTAAAALSEIRTASSALVALELDRSVDLPGQSGVLVATDEPVPFKAMTFTSSKWPHLDTRPGHLVRVSFGRLGDDEVLAAADDELGEMAVSGLAGISGRRPVVLHSRVRRWDDALAEIGPGHSRRIGRIRAELAERTPGLELVGGATEGVGVPACIGSARAAAHRLARKWQDCAMARFDYSRLNSTLRYLMFSVFSVTPGELGEDRQTVTSDLESFLARFDDTDVVVRGLYDVSGLRAEADFMIWTHAEQIEDLQRFYNEFRRTTILGR